MHGVNCTTIPDLDHLRSCTELTQLASRQADLDENLTLRTIQSMLPPDSSAVMAYPYPGLMQCLQAVFLKDPSGDEISAQRSHARVHLLLYYLWGSQITCDWEVCLPWLLWVCHHASTLLCTGIIVCGVQGLATALGVPADQARGWHAVAMLEHVLGQQLQPSRAVGCDTADAAAIESAVLELSTCQHHDMRLHAAELLAALKRPRLALQQAQRCCHSIVSTLTATQVAVPV